jgi:hypothetical protein
MSHYINLYSCKCKCEKDYDGYLDFPDNTCPYIILYKGNYYYFESEDYNSRIDDYVSIYVRRKVYDIEEGFYML